MPNLLQPSQDLSVDFVTSVPLDLLNAMYFTFLAGTLEGVGDWPARTRERMDPGLRAELDLLFTYPRRQPGIMGALNDALFVHYHQITDIDGLLRFVREMPADGAGDPAVPGIQGLAVYALRWSGQERFILAEGVAPRDALMAKLEGASDEDLTCIITPEVGGGAAAVLALFDDPEQVRARMLSLIRRFYDEHYRPDEQRRLACMRRSCDAHNNELLTDAAELARFLSSRSDSCLTELPDTYTRFVFVPSVDVGPYNSCADVAPVHGLHYALEPRFASAEDESDESTQRLALVYRALSDEQRLRILRLLRDGELYAQEIVERTGIHQSVVSRHLTFMKAVGLLHVRRQNNMKFYSLNAAMGEELRGAVDALLPSPPRRSRSSAARSR